MDNGSTLLNATVDAHWAGPPGPKLLLEWDPAHRVFLGNLFDLLLLRRVPRVQLVSKPARFWPDVFVPTGAPWWSFLESALWHTSVVLVLLLISQVWSPRKRIEEARVFSSRVAYYRPNPTFPALGSRAPRAPARRAQTAEIQRALQVAREVRTRPGALIVPPDLAAVTKPTGLPNAIVSTPVVPAMPLAATAGLQRRSPQIDATAVAPPPDVKQATTWRAGSLQVDVVAPAPELGGGIKPVRSRGTGGFQTVAVAPAPEVAAVSGRRGIAGPKVGVVAPPPALQGGSLGRGRRDKGGEGGTLLDVDVVAPAPDLPVEGQGGTAAGAPLAGFGGTGTGVVPPPPSVPGSGTTRSVGGGGAGSLASGFTAVPPPPSVGGVGRLTGPGGGGLAGGPGTGVVPPPPRVGGVGTLAGGRFAGPRGSGLAGGSGQGAVPPPPSVGGVGRLGGFGRGNGTGGGGPSGSGLAAVPPPPSVNGAGRLGGGRLAGPGGGGLAGGSGQGVVAPPPSVGGVGRLAGFGRGGGPGGSGLSAVPPAPSVGGAGRSSGPGGGGLSETADSVVPPPPSMDGAGGSGGRGDGNSLGDSNPEVVPPPPSVDGVGDSNTDQSLNPVVEELPVRIVGLAFALPGTSFSSSYEVFIAEKELSGHQVQLIKLVYWFLPYQRRLSEYHPDTSRMYKLRVTRDHACDESLLHMEVSPTGQVYTGSQLPADSLPSDPERQNIVLPCYRTTADDYQKAAGRR